MAPGTSGTLLGGGGEPPDGGMLLVRGCGVAPLAGGMLAGAPRGVTAASLLAGNDASLGAFVTGCEPVVVAGAPSLDSGRLSGA